MLLCVSGKRDSRVKCIVMCVREARQSSEAAVRQEQLMKSLIDHEEEQRRSRQLADSAIRKDKVSSWRPLSSCYANLHMNVTVFCPGLKKGTVLLEGKGHFRARNYILRALSCAE